MDICTLNTFSIPAIIFIFSLHQFFLHQLPAHLAPIPQTSNNAISRMYQTRGDLPFCDGWGATCSHCDIYKVVIDPPTPSSATTGNGHCPV